MGNGPPARPESSVYLYRLVFDRDTREKHGAAVIGPFVIGAGVIGPFVIEPVRSGANVSQSPMRPKGEPQLSVGVVTDSASSLPVDLAGANGVIVVPMWVAIGGQQYRDGELGLAEVLERAGEGLEHLRPGPG